ncbi:MAG: sigma-54 dependent transcriptional regulator [Polyangia bacterium]|nr:sigma-54 dependent transcriptional regulator [Polyangia bacterium]
MSPKLLIVDDEPEVLRTVERVLSKEFEVTALSDSSRAVATFMETEPDCVLLDVNMPKPGGLEILASLHATHPEVPVIMLTGLKDVETALAALRSGAYDYLTKPPYFDELVRSVARAVERTSLLTEVRRLRGELSRAWGIPNLIGRHPSMVALYEMIGRVASRKAPVLIRGDSGTGKELIARAIHDNCGRGTVPFVAVNCAAVPDSLFEAEFFGHERGAFTDAKNARAGYFEQANGGTLFLDEVGELSLGSQAKLLRALQERTIVRLGSTKSIPLDLRVICATNRDLEAASTEGLFRQDLYYRINVIPLRIPPLRERPTDIPLLVGHFLSRIAKTEGEAPKIVTPEAMRQLQSYQWPGNVRELENLMERLVALTPGEEISSALLPEVVTSQEPGQSPLYQAVMGGDMGLPLAVETLEKQVILEALRRTQGNKSAAATLVGISRRMLRYKLQQWNIEDPQVLDESGERDDE